jgi:transglutaminase-like putative cysteine protease
VRGLAPIVALGLALAVSRATGEELAVYRAGGEDIALFDQYDNDGYSLSVSSEADGSTQLRVRVSDSPLESNAPFPTRFGLQILLPAAPERDAFARRLTAGSRTEAEAVRRLLLGIAAEIRYDSDHLRRQDPAAVFASRRAYCVGFAELAVDLLRRVAIPARTVQGILRVEAGSDAYDPSIGGAYHRWVEVYYPDRGWVFSDPWISVNGVDARYIPFAKRALSKPRSLRLEPVSAVGALSYESVRTGETTVRVRATGPSGRRP